MFLLKEVYSRIKFASILIVIAYLVIAGSKKVKKVKVQYGPTMTHGEGTNCSEFAKYAKFNAYSVIHAKWFVFFYWAPVRPLSTYIFTALSSNHTRKLKRLFEGNCVLPVQWHSRQLLMEDNNNLISLLVERSDRGEYWQYPVARVRKGQKITPRDIRLKQTGDNRILGLFDCAADTLIVMSRLNDVPPKGRLHEEASRLGYRGTKGKSYLYQGHEWGPIEEADEDFFWDRREEKTISKDTSTEENSSERSSEKAEQPTTEPEYSKAKKPKPKKGTVLRPGIPEDDETCVKVMPELWNDPEPNSNPDNLLTKEDLNHVNSLIINENLALEEPDASTDSKQESNVDKESHNFPEYDKLHNDKDVHKMEMPDLTENKQESKTDKESENPPKNSKLHNDEDVHKMEIPESTDNKQESKTAMESEITLENRKLHNHKDFHKMEIPDSTDNKQESNTDKESKNPPENRELYNHKDVYKMVRPDSTDNKQESNTDKAYENENRELHKDFHKVETPDSVDNIEESNADKKSENPLENRESHNHKDLHKMETLDSIDNKLESNTDKKSENTPKNHDLHNHKDVLKVETPDSTDSKPESNTDKESESIPENHKLHNHKDVLKGETPDSVENKQETNTDTESEKQPENDNPHNHKVCRGTTEPDKDDGNCVFCYKSQLKYPSDESYVPDSALLMPDLKDNEDTPLKEAPHVNVRRFKIGDIGLLLEEQPQTEVPIPKVPSAKTPSVEVSTSKVSSEKSMHTKVPIPKVFAKTPSVEEPTLKVLSPKTPHTEVSTPKVPSAKSSHTEVPIPKVPAKTPSAEVPTPKAPSTKTAHAKVSGAKVQYAPRKRTPPLSHIEVYT